MKKYALLLVFIFALSSILLPDAGKKEKKNDWEYQLQKYSRIYSSIKKYYPEKIDREKLFFASIDGFLKKLDPHSYFMDPVQVRAMREDQDGNYFGIGTRITKYEDKLTVIAPMKGTPASKMGIMAGDVIISVNGKDTRTMTLDQATTVLRGAKGTMVTIEIMREGIDTPISFTIERAEIPLESVSYAVVHPKDKRVGFISIRTFGNTTPEEFSTKMKELVEKHHIEAVILDLRGNAGGSLYAAVDIADFFLPKGKIVVSIRGRKAKQNFRAKQDDPYETMPMAVLINKGSASASEIVASAIQDHKRGLIIGSRSWGKGLVQTVHRLSLNTSMALTTAKYYTPNNHCLQRDYKKLDDYLSVLYYKDYDNDKTISGGVAPDIYVKGDVYSKLMVHLISKGAFFKFSRHLIDQKTKIKKDFKVDEKRIAQFKAFLKENKIDFDAAEFDKDIDSVRYEIKKDVLTYSFSEDDGVAVFLESDSVTRKALEQLKIQLAANESKSTKQPGSIPGHSTFK